MAGAILLGTAFIAYPFMWPTGSRPRWTTGG